MVKEYPKLRNYLEDLLPRIYLPGMFFYDLSCFEQRRALSLFIQETSFDSLKEIILNNSENLDDKCVKIEVDLLNEISFFLKDTEEMERSESLESIISFLLDKIYYLIVGTEEYPGILGKLFIQIVSDYEHYYIIYKEHV